MTKPTTKLNKASLEDEALLAEAARRSPEAHAQYVIKDALTGKRLVLAECHKLMLRHVGYCQRAGMHSGVLAPWGVGKTSQLCLNLPLYLIGQNPNIRIKMVKGSDGMATDGVEAVKLYIENDQDFRNTWPGCLPDKNHWGAHSIRVSRPIISPDSTLESFGVLSQGMGVRADAIIFDDICTPQNTLINPAKKKVVIQTVENQWLSRGDPRSSFFSYSGTALAVDDLTQVLLKNRRFCWLIQRVNEDMTAIDCELVNSKGVWPEDRPTRWTIPLWEDVWNHEALVKRREEVGSLEFDRGFRHRPISSEDLTMPHAHLAFREDLSVEDAPPGQRFGGTDPFGKFAAIVHGVRSGKGKLWVTDIVRLPKPDGPSLRQAFIAAYRKNRAKIEYCENNASQTYIVDEILEHDASIPVKGVFTGQKKWDPQVGLPGLDVLCENGGLIIPMADVAHHEANCSCPWHTLQQEMTMHPACATDDVLMALWIFSKAARETRRSPIVDVI